jgi:hypothetical protein
MSPYAAHDMQLCAERYRYYGISLGLSIDQHVLRRTFALTFWYASVVQDDPRAVHCSYTSCLATVTLCFVIREVLLLSQRVTIKTRMLLLLLLLLCCLSVFQRVMIKAKPSSQLAHEPERPPMV